MRPDPSTIQPALSADYSHLYGRCRRITVICMDAVGGTVLYGTSTVLDLVLMNPRRARTVPVLYRLCACSRIRGGTSTARASNSPQTAQSVPKGPPEDGSHQETEQSVVSHRPPARVQKKQVRQAFADKFSIGDIKGLKEIFPRWYIVTCHVAST